MNNGWEASAEAWIADQGEHGDFSRRYMLDPVMLSRAIARSPKKALDVGCGEGRFCRMLRQQGVAVTGIDTTRALIDAAQGCDRSAVFIEASGERLPFSDGSFDLVISYLSLIDIPDFRAAIREMARVLQPGGALLIANLNSFITSSGDSGWVRNSAGERLHYPVDHYMEERSMWIQYRKIRVLNHHRPMSAYMRALLDAGLRLAYFDEPGPIPGAPEERAQYYLRAPWFQVMEWTRPFS